ncbi:MAG: M20 family metallo-hydrolase [Treponemataceae bacterium]|nr:M20 family metallo-hydrolase [Treponemataceae bacterium]
MEEAVCRVRAAVRNSAAEMVALQRILTAVPALAPENGGQGEAEKCAVLEGWLRKNGFSDIERHDAPDSRVDCGVRPNLVVTVPGASGGGAFWIMAHLDVVPPGDMSLWSESPWTVVEKDGRLYGRGVEDNQQGLVSAVFAALALARCGIKPARTVKLLFIADEEVGSTYGIGWLLKNRSLFSADDLILIPDGGDSRGETIEIAEKNLLWLRVHVRGRQSHGSRPDQGRNACLAASALSLKLHEMEGVFSRRDALFEPDRSTFEPTMRLANVGGINIIPGEDTFCMDCRILPCYTLESVLEEARRRCKEVEAQYGVSVDFEAPQAVQSPATSADAPVVRKLASALLKTRGISARTIGIGGGTVGAELRKHGLSAAVWSTLDERAHSPDEYCVVENMVADAETIAVMMMEE